MKGSFTGAISDKPGAAVAADGGTLFLDEVCEMAPGAADETAALPADIDRSAGRGDASAPGGRADHLRHQPRPDGRDPPGQFREDLFYRLYVVPIHLPPLRDRGQDIVEIARAALARFAAEEGKRFDGFSPETEQVLMAQDWPGNVRQLLNVVRNVVVLNDGGTVTPAMLPLSLALNLTAGADAPAEDEATARRLDGPALSGDPFRGLTLTEVERRASRRRWRATAGRYRGRRGIWMSRPRPFTASWRPGVCRSPAAAVRSSARPVCRRWPTCSEGRAR